MFQNWQIRRNKQWWWNDVTRCFRAICHGVRHDLIEIKPYDSSIGEAGTQKIRTIRWTIGNFPRSGGQVNVKPSECQANVCHRSKRISRTLWRCQRQYRRVSLLKGRAVLLTKQIISFTGCYSLRCISLPVYNNGYFSTKRFTTFLSSRIQSKNYMSLQLVRDF